jgi:hypothetical protein
MRLRLVVFGTSMTLLFAGCGSRSGVEQTRPARPIEWKSAIRDAYDGQINHQYKCPVVREAIARIPHDSTNYGAPGSVSGALLEYEQKVC